MQLFAFAAVISFMPELSSLLGFLIASVILLLVPGPAVLYIVAKSIDQGRRAGIVSVLGITLGSAVHVVAAAVGISALLMTSAMIFTLVKYAGAVYLIYLGIRKVLSKDKPGNTIRIERGQKLRKIFWEGFTVNLLNPKMALFFLAFLPQFISPDAGSASLQILLLGILFVSIGLISDSIYALLASGLGQWLKSHPFYLLIQKYVSGFVYITLGLMALAVEPSRKIR